MIITIRSENEVLLPAATKLGQGNIFTGVCLSTGGGLPQCMLGYTPHDQTPGARPPWDQTPRDQTPPWDQTPHGTRPFRKQTPSRDQTRPGSRHPLDQTPLGADPPRPEPPPPGKQTPAYGQRAAGTHTTGMHSCYKIK